MCVSKTVVHVSAQACVEVLGCDRPCTLHPTSDLAMRYSNRRTRNLSSVAGLAHDVGLDLGAACGRRRSVGRDERQVRRQRVFRLFRKGWIPLLLVVVVAIGAYAVVR